VKPLRRKRIEPTKLGGIHPAAIGAWGGAIFGRAALGRPVANGAFAVGMRRERRRRFPTGRVAALSFAASVSSPIVRLIFGGVNRVNIDVPPMERRACV